MCLIIETKKDILISKKLMEEFASRNDDGFGFMWIQNNVIQIDKNANGTVEELYTKYQALKEFEPIIHLRMKTHGLIDHENTHPYPVGNGIFLMHNGVFGSGNAKDTTKSDTWHFIEEVLKPLFALAKSPSTMLHDPIFQRIINHIIGGSNRVIMGDKHGYVFFNEPAWHTITDETTEAKGLRVSNTYAWSEGFAHPKARSAYQYESHFRNGGPTTLVKYTRFSDWGLIEIDTDLFADEDGEIWEKVDNKYIRMGNVSNNRRKKNKKKFLRMKEKETKEKANITKQVEKMVEIIQPAYHRIPEAPTVQVPVLLQRGANDLILLPDYSEDDSTDEHCEIILPTDPIKGEYEAFYYETMEREWAHLTLAGLEAMMKEEPLDAAKLLHRRLRNV